MPPLIALLDANVLYPAELRSFLMYLAVPGVYRAKWSKDIHEEWMSSLLLDLPGKMERWARNLNEDLRDGTDLTGIGTLLKKLGAHGLGENPVCNCMGSVSLGLARALLGASELPQSGKRWEGTKGPVGGVLDLGTIPSAFVATEAGELAGQSFDVAAKQAGRVPRLRGLACESIVDSSRFRGV